LRKDKGCCNDDSGHIVVGKLGWLGQCGSCGGGGGGGGGGSNKGVITEKLKT
jgi:hypothetical protein